MNRQKVDLTKYIEEHEFNFDNAFDSDAENQTVSHAEQFDSVLILFLELLRGHFVFDNFKTRLIGKV